MIYNLNGREEIGRLLLVRRQDFLPLCRIEIMID